ncbi:oxalate:formate antiporter, partial [Elysia marginata]
YFDQPEVLHQVRKVFILLGCCYAGMQLIGSLLLCDPPYEQELIVNNTMEEEEQTALQNYTKKGDTASLLPSNHSENREPVSQGDDVVNLRPLEVLRSKYFYMLWVIFLLNGQGKVFISTLYKAYGQTFIKDDSFLSVVGSFAAIFNASGRIWWGFLADKTSFRVSMMISMACFTCLILTFQVTQLQGRETFFIWVCLLFGSLSGSYSLLPTATAKCFGREYMAMNYGLVFTSQIISSPLGAFLSQQLISQIGWSGLCFMVSSFTFTSKFYTNNAVHT